MYTPTRIAGHEAVFEFLRQKLRAYQIIYRDQPVPQSPTQVFAHVFAPAIASLVNNYPNKRVQMLPLLE